MGRDHCCFAGCRPGPCGCCTNMPFHRDSCFLNETLEDVRRRLDLFPASAPGVPDNIVLGEN